MVYGLETVALTKRQAGGSRVEDVKIFVRSDKIGQDVYISAAGAVWRVSTWTCTEERRWVY